jgi:hypothetical protein
MFQSWHSTALVVWRGFRVGIALVEFLPKSGMCFGGTLPAASAAAKATPRVARLVVWRGFRVGVALVEFLPENYFVRYRGFGALTTISLFVGFSGLVWL